MIGYGDMRLKKGPCSEAGGEILLLSMEGLGNNTGTRHRYGSE